MTLQDPLRPPGSGRGTYRPSKAKQEIVRGDWVPTDCGRAFSLAVPLSTCTASTAISYYGRDLPDGTRNTAYSAAQRGPGSFLVSTLHTWPPSSHYPRVSCLWSRSIRCLFFRLGLFSPYSTLPLPHSHSHTHTANALTSIYSQYPRFPHACLHLSLPLSRILLNLYTLFLCRLRQCGAWCRDSSFQQSASD